MSEQGKLTVKEIVGVLEYHLRIEPNQKGIDPTMVEIESAAKALHSRIRQGKCVWTITDRDNVPACNGMQGAEKHGDYCQFCGGLIVCK